MRLRRAPADEPVSAPVRTTRRRPAYSTHRSRSHHRHAYIGLECPARSTRQRPALPGNDVPQDAATLTYLC